MVRISLSQVPDDPWYSGSYASDAYGATTKSVHQSGIGLMTSAHQVLYALMHEDDLDTG